MFPLLKKGRLIPSIYKHTIQDVLMEKLRPFWKLKKNIFFLDRIKGGTVEKLISTYESVQK